PALVLIDAISRQIPGVLGHQASAHEDSFAEGLLEHPNFTRPREWRGISVPEALLSGNHGKIREWKQSLSKLVTLKKRPDLMENLAEKDRKALKSFWEGLSEAEKRSCGLEDLNWSNFRGKPS
ncbi:MAG: tRNA (guanosine(37)-N1)-methyltransferase TrmD, partial [Bdellovibrionaceae bacterium]|nr:tRNA (guanosine(37)-N1)-methyltransferase TrmD [Pseudobdellovibrionaceae bacterium]